MWNTERQLSGKVEDGNDCLFMAGCRLSNPAPFDIKPHARHLHDVDLYPEFFNSFKNETVLTIMGVASES